MQLIVMQLYVAIYKCRANTGENFPVNRIHRMRHFNIRLEMQFRLDTSIYSNN